MGDAPLGAVFPPRSIEEIEAYDEAEVFDGYAYYSADDPEPGPNRSAAFRWGWDGARFDRMPRPETDPHYSMRREAARRHIAKTRPDAPGKKERP